MLSKKGSVDSMEFESTDPFLGLADFYISLLKLLMNGKWVFPKTLLGSAQYCLRHRLELLDT